MPAILFGSISTLADTSEQQREAFNAAFREHGLDWSWSQEEYRSLLQSNGGAQRVADYAAQRGEDVDADAVHATKSRIYQQTLAEGVTARPGVVDTISGARKAGLKVALVSTTARENLDALFDGLDDVSADDFDLVCDVSSVNVPKPDKAVYQHALDELGVDRTEAVAIEDNVGGLQSARAAGVRTIAFPNGNTSGHDFGEAEDRVDRLDPTRVEALAAAA